jgi:hypothetical protein
LPNRLPMRDRCSIHQFRLYLDEIIITHARTFALLLISKRGLSRKRWSRLQILPTTTFQDSNTTTNTKSSSPSISPISIPEDISSTIEKPLGILGSEQLAFLDRSFWVCSWRLSSNQSGRMAGSASPRGSTSALENESDINSSVQ